MTRYDALRAEVERLRGALAGAASREAWALDPVAQAAKVMQTPPPELAQPDPNNPNGFVTLLSARVAYVQDLVAGGYVQNPVFFTKAEADMLALNFGRESLPEAKLAHNLIDWVLARAALAKEGE
jgi:hypothetical protein